MLVAGRHTIYAIWKSFTFKSPFVEHCRVREWDVAREITHQIIMSHMLKFMRRSNFFSRLNFVEPFCSRLTFVCFVIFLCLRAVVVACNSHWYVTDKKARSVVVDRDLTAHSPIALDSECVWDICCVPWRGIKHERKGETERIKENGRKKHLPNIFAHARNSLEMFLFVCLCGYLSLLHLLFGLDQVAVVVSGFACLLSLSACMSVFCMCVNAKTYHYYYYYFCLFYFTSYLYF